MANVSVNYSIECAKPDHVYVVYGAGAQTDAQGHADDIVKFISNASKEKALTALFNGNLNKHATLHVKGASSTIPSNSSNFYVRYFYENPQKLKEDKEVYKDSNDKEVEFKELVFEVKEAEGSNLVNVYVVQDSMSVNTYSYYYELEADFTELFDYLTENFKPVA